MKHVDGLYKFFLTVQHVFFLKQALFLIYAAAELSSLKKQVEKGNFYA